ncbi:interleukin-27 subunit beta isoform X2 [Larus michahellis]|uniref:interleukin-27 subunit beta isoform X2 n=1 Tax=Larus michahellis TaxID=119627 RepID=UPI003D9B6C44
MGAAAHEGSGVVAWEALKASWPEPKPLSCGSGAGRGSMHGDPCGATLSGRSPLGTAFPARGSGLRPAGAAASRTSDTVTEPLVPDTWPCCGSWNQASLLSVPDMKWLWVVAFVAPACTVPYNCTVGSTGDGARCALQHGTLGTEVLLRCPAAAGGLAEWRRGDTVLGRYPAPGLALPNVSLAHEGHYSCHHPDTGETWDTVCLRLGYPPAPPAVECWAISYPQAVNCSWVVAPEPLLDTDFVATYRHSMGGSTEMGECIRTGPRSCSFGDVQMFSLIPYVVNVTAMNPLGAASRLLPFLLENIIKPDPPEDLRVSPIPGETKKLLLEWSPPASWPFPEYFPLKYHIRYAQEEESSVTKTIGPYEQTSYTLTGVQPGTLHRIQVAAKDFTDSGEFSAWSLPASGTPWMEP